MENAMVDQLLSQGYRFAECFELNCEHCGIVRVIDVGPSDACPLCGVKRAEWTRKSAVILTGRTLPLIGRLRRRQWNAPTPTEGFDDVDDAYAAGLEGRYSLHRPQGHGSA